MLSPRFSLIRVSDKYNVPPYTPQPSLPPAHAHRPLQYPGIGGRWHSIHPSGFLEPTSYLMPMRQASKWNLRQRRFQPVCEDRCDAGCAPLSPRTSPASPSPTATTVSTSITKFPTTKTRPRISPRSSMTSATYARGQYLISAAVSSSPGGYGIYDFAA